MARSIRGSGVKLTVPYVARFFGLWLLVVTLAVLVFSITSYLLLSDRFQGPEHTRFVIVLTIQTVTVLLAVLALAIFTTHRLAGPIIALKRAFDDVRDGDLERRLRFRSSDIHLSELEDAFNQMMGALQSQGGRKAS